MSASKWPRIKWNQANARLANAPFENLFSEQERRKGNEMSALDDVVLAVREGITQGNYEGWKKVEDARFELAQLREKAAEYDRIADLIDPHRAYCQSIHDQIVDLLHDDTSKEYPEIDALRARLGELESDHSLLEKRLQAVISDRDDYAERLTQSKIEVVRANERIAWLTSDIGDDGLAAINRLIATCERGDIAQQAAPDLSIARDEILRQARQLEDARVIFENIFKRDWTNAKIHDKARAWLAANPAPEAEQQP